MNRLTTPWGDLALTRFPEDPRDPLRAWDAADEYLLRHLAEQGTDLSGELVVLGDRWGALTVSLAAHRPVQITDSFLGQRATAVNLARNGATEGAAVLRSVRDTPPERIDVLLVRVPKSLALLEDQLHRLAPAVHEGTVVVGTGMAAEIHTSTLKLFERIIGPTRTSLAVRKARLIFCTPDLSLPRTPGPWPLRYDLPDDIGVMAGRTVTNHAGVFCADRLDIGTRFFLGRLPVPRGPVHVVDLGCGNGVVGTAAALAGPEASVTFVDESFSAVASAEATYRDNVPGGGGAAAFTVGDGLSGLADSSADLVLCNPPFHSHRATTDTTARRMFTDARRVLRPGGELWVVGNRHLGYHVTLRRIFGGCEVVAGHPKFVVLRAAAKAAPLRRLRAGTR
ncbi:MULTISPECIES: methyltransferase [Streptomyces]|uniref:Ribosomal RNA large subunit methyltransferase G n=1 Tax=Streptomyces tsukubensis (strain DSM 42081 / NBRC 108919 / NRRL 18488 / 9993) TaxID=1114943 RepID=I2MUU3_STRT9|nr:MULTISPECIES: methyltransferase [Streptomyces]AZK93042.1 50S rRNA methyltransferase [Streptomyces tsukubensis]EIF88540.1 rRNA (guanine-N(2)-)-methyltransferase [Streptomyces tsukubensis NRRL18488]MYS67046.1 methyltransferase [Streptomyces sp. SID5473]QKM70793.1 methyltransferase domain-containing protein [Streptomyces tsukubensis NRRL18488]TAI41089.1 methyltransferase domain-containing protein [Streptomyces tsukubensis]